MIPRPGWYVRGQYYELNRMHQSGPSVVGIATGVVSTSKLTVFDTITIPAIAIIPKTASGSGVRVQWGIWAIDSLVGHPIGAPLAQTGPFTPTVSGFLTQSLLSPITLPPGVYARGVAVSAAAGTFAGVVGGVEACNDQGNALATMSQGWSTPWTYSSAGLPTFTSGLTWTVLGSLLSSWALVT